MAKKQNQQTKKKVSVPKIGGISKGMKHSTLPGFQPPMKNFTIETLTIQSRSLKNNPLNDPSERRNPVLVPLAGRPGHHSSSGKTHSALPLIFLLSGFGGNGSKNIADKGFEKNTAQLIDDLVTAKAAPRAVYVFVDAWTTWGGSQFLNSSAVGHYEDYFVKELLPAVQEAFHTDSSRVALIGASSGGYGSLHLSSTYPQSFPYAAALAPDSDFAMSYKEDILKAAPLAAKHTPRELLERHRNGEILKLKNGFSILNALAMSAIYSPVKSPKTKPSADFMFPLNLEIGEWDPQIFKSWLAKDPLHFLPKRRKNLAELKGLFIEAGNQDEFHLYFGARKIHKILNELEIKHHFHEFKGGHFEMNSPRARALQWLQKKFSSPKA